MADKSTIQLEADPQELDRALAEAERMFQEYGDSVQDTTTEFENRWNSAWDSMTAHFTSVMRSALDTLRDLFNRAWDDISRRLTKGTEDFIKVEHQLVGINAQLRILGFSSGLTAGMMDKLARQLSQFSEFSKDALLNAEQVLSQFKNVRGDVFVGAMKSAIDLAVATGDLTGAARDLGEALNDPIQGLKWLTDMGLKFTDGQKKEIETLLKANDVIGIQTFIMKKLAEVTAGNAAQSATTLQGAMQRLNNIIDNTFEKIGKMLAPTIHEKLIPAFQKCATVVANFIDQLEKMDFVAEIFNRAIPIIEDWSNKIMEAGIQAFTFLETIADDWRGSFDRAWNEIKATAFESFAVIIEKALEWGQIIADALKPALDFAIDVFSHIVKLGGWVGAQLSKTWDAMLVYFAKIILNMMDNFESFVLGMAKKAAGFNWKMVWKPMADEFKVALDELPDFVRDADIGNIDIDPEGKIKDFAAQLHDDAKGLDDVGSDFENRFAANLDKNRKRLDDFIAKMKQLGEEKPLEFGDDRRPFEFPNRMHEEQVGGGRGGNFGMLEDLVSMNRRIQQAALRDSPEVMAIKVQTSLLQQWKDQDHNDKMIIHNDLGKPGPMPKPNVAVLAPG